MATISIEAAHEDLDTASHCRPIFGNTVHSRRPPVGGFGFSYVRAKPGQERPCKACRQPHRTDISNTPRFDVLLNHVHECTSNPFNDWTFECDEDQFVAVDEALAEMGIQ